MNWAEVAGAIAAFFAAVAAGFSCWSSIKTAKATKRIADTTDKQTELWGLEFISKANTPDERDLREHIVRK